MAQELINETDLPPAVAGHPSAGLMVAGANGQARRISPTLVSTTATAAQKAEAKLVLLGAVVRWTQQGADATQQQSAGPFALGTDTQRPTGYRLWPSEVQQLREIVTGPRRRRAFLLDRMPVQRADQEHHPSCDFFFFRGNGLACSCGLD